MVSFKNMQIILQDNIFDLNKFEVWFQTPKGLCSKLKDAIIVVEGMDMDPDLCIRPIPVAINTKTDQYEVLG